MPVTQHLCIFLRKLLSTYEILTTSN
uniref:Uncharacterized protein n=1 Tax=Anguilla anguilla TaxID=7936 RepID=A0A0E9QE69_ANGAN